MSSPSWMDSVNVAITVCDAQGTVIEMNPRSAAVFASDGGRALIGKSLFACHNECSQAIIKDLLAYGKTHCYTIAKNGIKKMIYQGPWFDGDKIAGLVELTFEIPFDLPHFIRPDSPSPSA
jgi:hypothetical protein